jgi:hypothetical protein
MIVPVWYSDPVDCAYNPDGMYMQSNKIIIGGSCKARFIEVPALQRQLTSSSKASELTEVTGLCAGTSDSRERKIGGAE